MRTLEVGVLGLGKFGLHFGKLLFEQGHTVIGVDASESVVNSAQNSFTKVFIGDATDKLLLQQLHFQKMDCVVVSVGHSMETSILASLNLLDLNAKKIIVKAMSIQHKEVLLRIGVHQVVQPEADYASHIARKLSNPMMLDFIDIGGGVLLQQIVIEKWAGKSLIELNLTNTYRIMAVAIKRATDSDFSFVPDSRTPLAAGDRLILIGNPDAVMSLKP